MFDENVLAAVYLCRARLSPLVIALDDLSKAISISEELLINSEQKSREILISAYTYRGERWSEEGYYSEAIADYERAISLKKEMKKRRSILALIDSAIIYEKTAYCMCKVGDIAEAIYVLTKAINILKMPINGRLFYSRYTVNIRYCLINMLSGLHIIRGMCYLAFTNQEEKSYEDFMTANRCLKGSFQGGISEKNKNRIINRIEGFSFIKKSDKTRAIIEKMRSGGLSYLADIFEELLG